MWLLRGFEIINRRLSLMLRFSTPWLLLIVLLHFLSAIDMLSLRKDECMKNIFVR